MASFQLCRSLTIAAALVTVLHAPFASATYGEPTPNNYCLYACHDAVGYVTFNVSSDAALYDYYKAYCTNTLQIRSTLACGQTYCSASQIRAGYDLLNEQCNVHADVQWPVLDALLVSPEKLAAIDVVNSTVKTTSTEAPLDVPIIPDAEWQDVSFRTVSRFYNNWWISTVSRIWAMHGFWALVLAIGMLHRALELFQRRRSTKESSWWLWIRRRLILPATFGKHCQESFGWTTIPPRLESILLGLYLLLNIVFLFPGYNLFADNAWYPETKLQLARYLSDRTGILSIAQLPFVWVFASRNDPFLLLTGWSFATYNRFHRWIARVATMHAVIHSIGYSVFSYYEGGGDYTAEWAEQDWYCGVIATIVMTLMLGASVYRLRQKLYDLFLVVHIAFAAVFLGTLWYHVKIFDGEFNGFIWPCVAIWALDRLLRIARVISSSLIPRFTKRVKATASYNRDFDLIRLDITDYFPAKQIMPGTFYFLYEPGSIRGYESYPFTLCSWQSHLDSTPSTPSPPASMHGKEIQPIVGSLPESAQLSEVHHTLVIRPYGGFTARLKSRLTAAHESASSLQITALLEGPYGNALDLSGYSDVLILAGGSGITAAISHAHHLLPLGTTNVRIVWAVPQPHLVDDVCAHELAGVLGDQQLSLEVYLTSAAKAEEQEHSGKLTPAQLYEVKFGRPDLLGVMREARRQSTRSLAVVTCGTPQMADLCRAACVKLLGEAGPPVGYYNETMLW